MLAARRTLLLVCFLLAPMFSMLLVRATSHAQSALATSPVIVPIANVPQARGVTIDTLGNIYALSRDAGTVYKITPAGQVSTFVDLPDGDEGYVGPIFDPGTGNLFISRYMRRTGTEILKITPAGVVSTFVSQLVNPTGMALDGQGNLFVSSDTNPGTVSKITASGNISVFATGLNRPDGLAFGPNGDLFIADRGTNQVMRVPASGGSAVVFATGFANPMDVEFDRAGRLFVTNGADTIVTVDTAGLVSPFVSGLTNPVGLAFDQQNQLYVAEYGAGRIIKVSNPVPWISTVAGVPNPRGVTIDTDGNLFAMDRSTGTVYKITPAGQISTLADLLDSTDGYVGPVFDPASGNLFISKYGLGTGNEVFRVTMAGVVSVFATGIAAPASMVADGQGNLFVSSYTCPGGAVYKVSSAGVASPFSTGLCRPDGLAIGPNGDLFVGDRGSQRILRVPAAGGAASVFATGISNPIAVAFDHNGQLFAANYDNGTVYAVDANGTIRPVASGFYSPNGLAFDQQDQLYVTNSSTNQIVTLAGPGPNIVPIADVQRPRGVTFDTDSNLYSLSIDIGTLYKITPAGVVTTLADLPDAYNGYVGPVFDPYSGNLFVAKYANGTGNQVFRITPAGVVSVFTTGINAPGAIAADGQGNLFISNYTCPGGAVYKVSSTGAISLFGTGLCHSYDIAIGPNGDLFIGDGGSRRIMRIPAAGGAASVFATGVGVAIGVAFDRNGQLFAADYYRGLIYAIDANGSITQVADGFYLPTGLAFDQQNQLYLSDLGNHKVVRVDGVGGPLPTATATATSTPTATPTSTATPTATPTNAPPPIADRLTINGGALTTTSANVRLDVSAANAGGGQAGLSMSFSNDGISWSDWQDYAASTLWQLTSGDGVKTVYGRFKNSAGAISAIVSDTIRLDTSVQFEYSVTINNGALYTNKVAVQLTISARPRTAEMQISNDGGFTGAAWEPYDAHKAWQITRYRNEEVTRLVYVRFRDVEGNISSLYLDDIILDPDAPYGSVSIAGQGTLLQLAAADDLSGVAGMRVSAQPNFGDTDWEPFSASYSWNFEADPVVYVQFRDVAGNLSPSYRASLSGTATLFLPLVQR